MAGRTNARGSAWWARLTSASNAPFIYGTIAHALTVVAVVRMFLRRRQRQADVNHEPLSWIHAVVTIGCLAFGHLLLGCDLALRVDTEHQQPDHGEESASIVSVAIPIAGFVLLFVHGAYTWMHEGMTMGVVAYTLAMGTMCVAIGAMYAYGRRAKRAAGRNLRCNRRLPFWPRFACDPGAREPSALLPLWLVWIVVLASGALTYSYVDGSLFGWVDLSGETHQYRFALLLVAIFYLLNLIMVVQELDALQNAPAPAPARSPASAHAHALSIRSSIPGSPSTALA